MPTIDIIIRNKTASAVNPPCIVCGNSDYNVKFNFDEEWQAHNNKIGVFAYNRCGEWQSEKVLFEGDTCPVPALHGVRSVWIGVTAGDVRTSTPADVPCRMGATVFSDTTEKPSEDIWGQILDKLNTVGTVQRINTVISYDVDRGEHVSSVDFATLLAAAKQPDKYTVTATRQESLAEREYALKEIKQSGDFYYLCFFCSVPQYSGSEMSAPLVKYILISSKGHVSFLETDISALAVSEAGALHRASMDPFTANSLGKNAVNFGREAGATGVMSFATEYGLYHPRYGWSYNSNVASGNFSAAFGSNTKANQEAQFVCGKQNEEDVAGVYQFIVGVGGKNGFAVTTRGEIVMPDPNATSTTYMKARFNSDGTITLSPVADDITSYTTECTANRTTRITAESTDTQYPTAKAVYDAIHSLPASTAETWTTVAETTTTEVTSTIYLTFPACRKVRILIDTLGGVTSGQVQVILNAGQDPYIGEARAAIAKTGFSTSARYIAGVVQVDADWCIGGMQYGYAAIGARADGAQKDLMQPPVSMMWANATAYTTAKKTYKETGITEVCIKGVSLPTDAGFDVGAHIIVEGIAR
ncbi:MAG: hypothetical protein ACLT1M_01440 [Christensenellales bacterium]